MSRVDIVPTVAAKENQMSVNGARNIGDVVVDRETEQGAKRSRLKATIVIEYESLEDLEESLTNAAGLARAGVMLMSFGSTKPHGPRVSVRTTKMRGSSKPV